MPYSETLKICSDRVCKSSLVSRNINVSKRRTSVRLEPEMWKALEEVARREQCTIHDICTLVSGRKKEQTSLTAAIRVFIMLYFRAASTEDGHKRAGHGDFSVMRMRGRQNGRATMVPSNVKTVSSGDITVRSPKRLVS
ncbi:MAG: ribbon-helix-helix domain-containing protein [Alphaproteobacteria bacterium]|nr:ribbon-helix-helix domain-containing protein [Alphaproteobacteria bacterium]